MASKSATFVRASRWHAPSARSVTTSRRRTAVTRRIVLSSRSSAPAAASRPCIARPAERNQAFETRPIWSGFLLLWSVMTSFADLTTIGVGGPIATFLEPTTRVGVIEAVEEADSQGLPLCVIGGGSNMLVSDTPFEGVVVRDARRSISVLDEAAPVEDDGRVVHVNAEAGCNWMISSITASDLDWKASKACPASPAPSARRSCRTSARTVRRSPPASTASRFGTARNVR